MSSVLYISPSSVPSRSANSVHVVHQCEGLSQCAATVDLVARRTLPSNEAARTAIIENYGVEFRHVNLKTVRAPERGAIAAIALAGVARALAARNRYRLILSRNLYASYLLALAQIPHIYETHMLGIGRNRGLERFVLTRGFVQPLLISSALRAELEKHHQIELRSPVILHDAAPTGIVPLSHSERSLRRSTALASFSLPQRDFIVGYFGHLYPGRGLEIIQATAAALPQVPFLVFGGNDSDIASRRGTNTAANLHFLGHVPHAKALEYMLTCDVLLMPYQRTVSIGVGGHDTANWMSPMKMFEYLGTGNAIVSSDLPVLREVLEDGKNALLVSPDDPSQWIRAVRELQEDTKKRIRLGEVAHEDYRTRHTWVRRAEAILATQPGKSRATDHGH